MMVETEAAIMVEVMETEAAMTTTTERTKRAEEIREQLFNP
jgi:hypothetical protein